MTKQKAQVLVNTIAEQLKHVYKNDIVCYQYARWILESICNQRLSLLIAHDPIELTSEQEKKLNDWLDKLINQHMPLQYLLGSVPFNGVDILVEPPVLIPRPETEEWIITLINKLKKLEDKKLIILDLCTGSGCIALALAKALPESMLYATDISHEALTLAEKNAQHNKITNIQFINSDLFASIPQEMKFDIIVTNPPYISEDEWLEIDPSVTQWEDPKALIAPDNGLGIIEKIIKLAPNFINVNDMLQAHRIPQLTIEIGYKQARDAKKIMKETGYIDIKVEKDLFGNDRIITGRIA